MNGSAGVALSAGESWSVSVLDTVSGGYLGTVALELEDRARF